MKSDRPPNPSADIPQHAAQASEEQPQVDTGDQSAKPAERRPRRARWAIAAIAVLVAAGMAAGVARLSAAGGTSRPGVVDNADPTGLQAVTRQDLSSQTQVSATLGYAGTYSVVDEAQGTVTAVPSIGQVVRQGHALYQVSGAPVVLLYGATPAYRSLSEGMTGADVEQLNKDLVALRYAPRTELSPASDEFTYWTKVGVEKLQAALGVTEDGMLSLGQVLFEPTTVRVTAVSATLGGPAQPGQPVLYATSITRQVSIALDADLQSEVAAGDRVIITLPNNETTPGVISSVGTVAVAPASGSPGSTPTVTVLVNPTYPAATGTWDQAPVNVTITTGTVSDALVVPVDALLAQAGDRYAVEVVGADGSRRLVPVSLGLFDDADGLVQVTGSDLTAGQQIVVPNL
jgi:hypothetical protein